MINPKYICISASIGFFLSFIIGLFSPVHFSTVILRAVLFSFICAALGAGISFVYDRFLSNENSSFSVDSDSVMQKTNPGSVVNIVVDDSNLYDDGVSPKFTVLKKHEDLKDLDANGTVKTELSPQISSADSGGLSSVAQEQSSLVSDKEQDPARSSASSSAKTVSSDSSSESTFKPVSLGAVTSSPSSGGTEGQEQLLDELPDIAGIQPDLASDDSSSADYPVEEIVSDSEFATGGKKMKEQPISGDTSVMAKAIQTLLAKDD
ncbi:MAG: hypothetical protein IJ727_00785 [Treponema sp.]|nr:hypothetical protein [Treponema sp.]